MTNPLRAIPGGAGADGWGIHTIRDLEAERAVLGAVLLSDRVLEPVTTEIGLRSDHFSSRDHAAVWTAATAILDRGDRIDSLTLHRELRGEWSREAVEELAAEVPSVANAKAYARRVLDAYRWEHRRTSHLAALAAVADRNEKTLHAAEAEMTRVIADAGAHLTEPAALGAHMARVLSEPRGASLPVPWPTVARDLHMRRGQTTVLAGWTSIGKSVAAADLAIHAGRHDQHVVTWTNEMSREELVARYIQHATGLNANHVLDHDIPADKGTAVLEALHDIPFGVVEAFGWSAHEIARHLRHIKPDLAIVDHFHQLPDIGETAKADDAVRVLTAAAHQCDAHLVLVAQLNHARDSQLLRPPPALRDIRGTGALQSLPNNVLFFHRRQEELRDQGNRATGQAVTTDEGTLHIAKQRGGPKDRFTKVRFDAHRLRVTEEPSWSV